MAGGEDGRVSLWPRRTGAPLSSVTVGRPGTAAYVGYNADGHTVSVATWDGEVYHLDIRLERWVEFACEVAGRNLAGELARRIRRPPRPRDVLTMIRPLIQHRQRQAASIRNVTRLP